MMTLQLAGKMTLEPAGEMTLNIHPSALCF